ncbi:pyridoxal-phosphate dependent enzyme [Virgibacillus kimchii]
MASEAVSLQDIWQAKKRISASVHKTPLLYSPVLSKVAKANIYLKLENIHPSDSFKIRGAANKLLTLTPDEKEKGVATFSTGNFGRSVAYIANKLGIASTICISKRVPEAKVKALQKTGANIEIAGNSQDEAEQRCYELQKKHGLTVVHPFDDPYMIAGNGTIGLEILEELPEANMIISGLSGGGLLSGAGIAMRAADRDMRIIGVSTEQGAAMYESIQAGKPVLVEEADTLADSLLGGIGLENRYTFELVQKYADDILLINEEEIADGIGFIQDEHRMAIEGAAAAGVGAILHGKVSAGSHTVIIISGSSINTEVLLDVTNHYLLRKSNILRGGFLHE